MSNNGLFHKMNSPSLSSVISILTNRLLKMKYWLNENFLSVQPMKSTSSTQNESTGHWPGYWGCIFHYQRGQVKFQHRDLSCISVYACLQDSTNTFKDLCVQGMILDTNIFFSLGD